MSEASKDHARLVARALTAPDTDERDRHLEGHSSAFIAASFLGALTSVTHPSSVTMTLCDVLRVHAPEPQLLRMTLDTIADPRHSFGVRVACALAIATHVEDLALELTARGVTPEDTRAIIKTGNRWVDVAADPLTPMWWDVLHDPLPGDVTTEILRPPATGESYAGSLAPIVGATLPLFTARSASEVHARRQLADYEEFSTYLSLSDGDFVDRVTSRDRLFVLETLVHSLLTCEPSDREFYRNLAINFGSHSPFAATRLGSCVVDTGRDWDLREECFTVLVMTCGRPLHELGHEEFFAPLYGPDWSRLVAACRHRVAVASHAHLSLFAEAVSTISLPAFDDVCDALNASGRDVAWDELLVVPGAARHWPRIAEELAAREAVHTINRLEECAERTHTTEGRARIQRALMRLRAVAG